MTILIAHHPETDDLALFESDGEFWIGVYDKFLTHQNPEPSYTWISNATSKADGIRKLFQLDKNTC
jgi:hypothetical protein